jgi:hypothetical protein
MVNLDAALRPLALRVGFIALSAVAILVAIGVSARAFTVHEHD